MKSQLLFGLVLLAATTTMDSVMAGFDLNDLPEEAAAEPRYEQQQQQQQQPSIVLANVHSQPIARPRPAVPARKAPAKAKSAMGPYEKFLKLLDKLKVCDKVDFDINQIVLPEHFVKESRIRLLLLDIGKQGLIKPADKPRYDRIVKNCLAIEKAVLKRSEENVDESQMSGFTFEDLAEKYKHSPLEELKARAMAVFGPKAGEMAETMVREKATTTPTIPMDPQPMDVEQQVAASHAEPVSIGQLHSYPATDPSEQQASNSAQPFYFFI